MVQSLKCISPSTNAYTRISVAEIPSGYGVMSVNPTRELRDRESPE